MHAISGLEVMSSNDKIVTKIMSCIWLPLYDRLSGRMKIF